MMKETQKRRMSDNRIFKLIEGARKRGVKRLKIGEIEFELNELQAEVDNRTFTPETGTQGDKMPTGDELLFYSTPQYDILQEEKKSSNQL